MINIPVTHPWDRCPPVLWTPGSWLWAPGRVPGVPGPARLSSQRSSVLLCSGRRRLSARELIALESCCRVTTELSWWLVSVTPCCAGRPLRHTGQKKGFEKLSFVPAKEEQLSRRGFFVSQPR